MIATAAPSWCHWEARDLRYWQLSPSERRARLLETLDDPEAYTDVFGYLINGQADGFQAGGFQAVVDCLEGLTENALKRDEWTVTLPAAVAVAAVLALKGRVKRTRGNPGDSLRVHREKKRTLRRPHPGEVEMIVWARERKEAIMADAKAKGERIKADDAHDAAASAAKKMFSSRLSIANIADRMKRPSKYAPHEVAKRKRHPGKISGD